MTLGAVSVELAPEGRAAMDGSILAIPLLLGGGLASVRCFKKAAYQEGGT